MLSIITSFGCKYDCEGCIWFNEVKEIYPRTFWTKMPWQSKLYEYFENNPNETRFSISGGGDPIDSFRDENEFWFFIEAFAAKRGLRYDVHTSYDEVFERARNPRTSMYSIIYILDDAKRLADPRSTRTFDSLGKIVFHLRHQFAPIPDTLGIETRFSYVVHGHTTIGGLKRLEAEIPKEHKLTLREFYPCGTDFTGGMLLGPPDEVTEYARTISERREGARYVEQGDYAEYLWPDGTIRQKFLR